MEDLVVYGYFLHKLEEPEERLAVPYDGAHVALELEHPRHDGVGAVQLALVHLGPHVIGALKGEVCLLALGQGADLFDLPVVELYMDRRQVGSL